MTPATTVTTARPRRAADAPMAEVRCRGDRGSGAVTLITLLFAFTFGGLVWLSHDVDRAVANRSTAQSVAFQSARSGAQQLDLDVLRASGEITVDPAIAVAAARHTAVALFASYGVTGQLVDVAVDGARVSVTVVIDDSAGRVTGRATVRAVRSE